jgi:HAD superfamily hydrolase (TIGR01484 family)
MPDKMMHDQTRKSAGTSPGHTRPRPTTLATDLDGTLIPLAGFPEHVRDLSLLARLVARNDLSLVFVTGRHFYSVQKAIAEHALPVPQWILCDVGTSAYEYKADGNFHPVERYAQSLSAIVGNVSQGQLLELVDAIPHLRIQESEKQAPFKTSFYAPAEHLNELVMEIKNRLAQRAIPYQIVSSVDPFNGDGLIDLLPAGVSKASALQWWCRERNLSQESVVFAGDSGNDLAAFVAGYQTVIVGNASGLIVQKVREAHHEAGWANRLLCAEGHATSGVLEGLRHFLNDEAH